MEPTKVSKRHLPRLKTTSLEPQRKIKTRNKESRLQEAKVTSASHTPMTMKIDSKLLTSRLSKANSKKRKRRRRTRMISNKRLA